MPRAPIEDRFWRNVKRGDPGECWPYGSGKGYGRLSVGPKGGPLIGAHVYSYQIHKGPVPSGMVVMHDCDNPCCVNPAHLTAGPQKRNIRDMVARGRQPDFERTLPDVKGEANGHALLTERDVRDIRAAAGVSNAELARKYGVSVWTIRDARSGRNWKHVT